MKLIINKIVENAYSGYTDFTFTFTLKDDYGNLITDNYTYSAYSKVNYLKNDYRFSSYELDYIRYHIENAFNRYSGCDWCKDKILHKYFLNKFSKKIFKHLCDNIDSIQAKEHIAHMNNIYDQTENLDDAQYNELIEYMNKRRLMRTLE